ncbi:MAG: NF038122 family metalloprotease [Phycisphaerales bacterium]
MPHLAAPAAIALCLAAPLAHALTVVFTPTGPVPPGADAVLAQASTYLASLFTDPVTIEIGIVFDEGGATFAIPTDVEIDYEIFRAALVDDMDADDWIQDFLPLSELPALVPTDATPAQVDRIVVPTAVARAVGLAAPGSAGMITMGAEFDTDPSDGVDPDNFPMIDALIHEVGHIMGFASYSIDFPGFEGLASPFDIFRFPADDGANDANPDTPPEFTARARTLTAGLPAGGHVIDLVFAEFPAWDGSVVQASHLMFVDEQTSGVMAGIPLGSTLAPDYFRIADLAVLDAMGWDRAIGCSPADLAEPLGTLDFSDVLAFLTAFGAMDPAADLADPEGVFDFSDVLAFLSAFATGCP